MSMSIGKVKSFLREVSNHHRSRERIAMKFSSLQTVCVAAIGMFAIGVQAGETQAEADFHTAQIKCNEQTGEARAACLHDAELLRDRALNRVQSNTERQVNL